MKNKRHGSRRTFIKKSLAASSFIIVPRHVLGGPGYLAPSDQLNLAAIGSGGKGASDISNASVKGREHVAALCDVDFSGTASKTAALFGDFSKVHLAQFGGLDLLYDPYTKSRQGLGTLIATTLVDGDAVQNNLAFATLIEA